MVCKTFSKFTLLRRIYEEEEEQQRCGAVVSSHLTARRFWVQTCQLAGGLPVWSLRVLPRDCMGFRQVLLSSPKDMQVLQVLPVYVNVGMLSVSMCQP